MNAERIDWLEQEARARDRLAAPTASERIRAARAASDARRLTARRVTVLGLLAVVAECVAGTLCLYANDFPAALVLAMFAAVTLAALPFWAPPEVMPPE